MKGVKITALSKLGQQNLDDTKLESVKLMVKYALKKLKIKLNFNKNSLIIENPAFKYCRDLDHPKVRAGLEDIRRKYRQIGAVEGKDYIIEVLK